MLRNYFISAWRSLVKGKFHSLINIAGLSAGMAVAILIGLWIYDELHYNKNFENYDRIAQVMQTETHNGTVNTAQGNVLPLAAELRNNYGNDFKYVVLSSWSMNSLVTSGEKKVKMQGNYMEPDAPAMLSLNMLKGTRESFKGPSSVLISGSLAKALFGTEDPIGKVIKMDGEIPEKVTGVYEDFPRSSSFNVVSFIAPFFDLKSWVKGNEDNWYNESFQVFAQLRDNANIAAVSAKIKNIKHDKIDARTASLEKPEMVLHPMSKWHLYSEFKNGVNTGGAVQYVWMFAIIGAFVLLLACINFMNLSTARSEKRAKEVGIRKAIGSTRAQLISQFFSESLMLALFAFLVAVSIVSMVLPLFNQIAGKEMHVPWNNFYFWVIAISFAFITGIVAGLYPALYLSSFRPVKVLKGAFKAGRFSATPRKILVVLQFTVSVTLIICTITVFRQVQFAKSRPAGYTLQGLITMVMNTYDYHKNFSNIRHDLIAEGAITDMAESNTPVTENDHYNNGFTWEGIDPKVSAKFNTVNATEQYGKTVGFEFISGRDFSSQFGTDSSAVLINETAAKYIGFKDPVGNIIKQHDKPYHIIGVVKDMVTESPYEPVKQTAFFMDTSIGGIVNIKLSPNKTTASALAMVRSVCKKYSTEEPFSYTFVDEEYARKFADEERVGKLAACFAVLAIFISCLGIFGMASFMAEQRTKEIGVRKVLGASVLNLWQLLSKDFFVMIIISFVLATPLAFYFMSKWLMNYQYHATLSWWIFAAAGFGALMITLLTVSFQSIKAATANPVKSLRSE